jgi:hypothetical protein
MRAPVYTWVNRSYGLLRHPLNAATRPGTFPLPVIAPNRAYDFFNLRCPAWVYFTFSRGASLFVFTNSFLYILCRSLVHVQPGLDRLALLIDPIL